MDRKHEVAAIFTDCVAKLLYLSCILEKLKGLNLHGKLMNIITTNSKIQTFEKKLQNWADLLESGKMDIFLT